jgi:putative methionine-R-sulfoxide reductase with GAF domain
MSETTVGSGPAPLPDANASLGPELRRIIARFHADTGTIHLLDGATLKLAALHGDYPPPLLAIIRAIPIGKGMAGLCAERKAPVTACNISTDTSGDVRPGATMTGMEGAIVVPILAADGSVRGTLGIANREPRTWTEEETEQLLQEARGLAAAG